MIFLSPKDIFVVVADRRGIRSLVCFEGGRRGFPEFGLGHGGWQWKGDVSTKRLSSIGSSDIIKASVDGGPQLDGFKLIA